MTHRLRLGVIILLCVAAVFFGLIHIDKTPPLWWDEGWTLTVARNWIEFGHYGVLQSGAPGPPTMSGQFPVVATAALSMKAFGVGIWQGRLPGLIFTVCSLLLLYYISARIYTRAVGLLMLGLVLFLPVKWGLHPFYMGRMVLGEMHCVFFLLAGFACFLAVDRRKIPFFLAGILLLGMALMSKEQLAPFLAMSFAFPAALFLRKRQRGRAWLMAAGIAGSFGAQQLFLWFKHLILTGHTVQGEHLSGLAQSVAVVLSSSVRISMLEFALLFGLPTVIGLGFEAKRFLVEPAKAQSLPMADVVRLMLWSLCVSWFAWFVLLSVGWERYAFPPLFLSTPFVAALLFEWTDGLNLWRMVDTTLGAVKRRSVATEKKKHLGAVAMVILMMFLSSVALYRFAVSPSDNSVADTAHFINQNAKPGSVIETYDSELFFLLKRPYHFPPPQMDVEYIRQTWLHEKSGFRYDPLVADPEYLIVGPFGKEVRLYDAVIGSGGFKLLRTIGLYSVYERAR